MTISYRLHFSSYDENKLITVLNKYRLLSHLEFYKNQFSEHHKFENKNQKAKEPETKKRENSREKKFVKAQLQVKTTI